MVAFCSVRYRIVLSGFPFLFRSLSSHFVRIHGDTNDSKFGNDSQPHLLSRTLSGLFPLVVWRIESRPPSKHSQELLYAQGIVVITHLADEGPSTVWDTCGVREMIAKELPIGSLAAAVQEGGKASDICLVICNRTVSLVNANDGSSGPNANAFFQIRPDSSNFACQKKTSSYILDLSY
ncbi:hypothetical protein B0H17DRAFT_1053349 [Mycena rosella]|uniref:Uncharacterized protein n=1 Tax=Mycena rosella TaxID=1033263 RepID=A0AAD7DPQ3_MYCRO|nr:hypothetical protein B0H17DRAFT_1053349 [Mycena rosella]